MSKKQSLIICFIVLAVAAIIAGFCFVFLGNDIISQIPSFVRVENVEGQFHLITEYSGQYGYQFKLEQMIDGQYTTVSVVDSEVNSIKLSEQSFNIVAGQSYRFSACYTTENGAGNSEFSSPLIWQPTWNLDEVDYEKVLFDEVNCKLSWDSVYMADGYTVKLVDVTGEMTEFETTTNSIFLANVNVGKYDVYIIGVSENDYIGKGVVGEGIEIEIFRDNEILNVERLTNNSLKIVSSEIVEKFEVFVNGEIIGTLEVETFEKNSVGVKYVFINAGVLLNEINFEESVVQIRSVATDFVGESVMTVIN